MKKVSNLSLSNKILIYLKRGIALVSAAATIVSASKTSAKAEGNSNLPNQTNITQETNTPIPSMEDVVVDAVKNEIIDIETLFNDLYVYTTREHGKFARRGPQVDNNIAKTIAINYFPYMDKNCFDFCIKNEYLIDDEIDEKLGVSRFDTNFYLTPREMFGETIVKAVKNYVTTCKKSRKEPTIEEAMMQIPDYSKLFPEMERDEYLQKCQWLVDIIINGLKSEGYKSMIQFFTGLKSIDEVNRLIKKEDKIVNEIFNECLIKNISGENGLTYWKLSSLFRKVVKDIIIDNLKPDKRFKEHFKERSSLTNPNPWVIYHLPNTDEYGGVRTVDKNDSFAVNCIWYYMLDVDTLVLAKLVEKTIFAEGTKYHALWENGGMEDFDETQYIISEENGISK